MLFLSFYIKQENGSYDLNDPSGVEYFFVNGPLSYTENLKYRTSIEKTFGGCVVIDYGPDNHEIRLEGEFYIYFRGLPSKPSSSLFGDSGSGLVQSGLSAVKSFASSTFYRIRSSYLSFGSDFRSGLQEFKDFLFILHYSKSLEAVEYTSNDPQGRKVVNFFKNLTLNWKEIAFVFRDYDRDRTVEVVLPQNGFTISRSVGDTNTYKYSLNLVVVKELDSKIKSYSVRNNFNPFRALSGLTSELENLVNLPLKLSGGLLNVARFTKSFADSGLRLSTSFSRMKGLFTSRGKLARITFNSAGTELKLISKTRGLSPDEVAIALDSSESSSKSNESEFRSALSQARTSLSSLDSAIASYTISLPGNGTLESESVKPGADFTAWIDTEAYDLVITAREILNEIEAALAFSSIDESFRMRAVNPGETYQTIAKTDLGAMSLGTALAIYNGDSDPSTISKKAIKLTGGIKTNVFIPLANDFKPIDLEIALLGADIRLTENRGISVSPDGDLGIVLGEEALINNILDLLDIPIGALPANPTLGNPLQIGEILNEVTTQSIRGLLTQIRSDPRIENAEIINLSEDGDTITLGLKITPVTKGSFVISL